MLIGLAIPILSMANAQDARYNWLYDNSLYISNWNQLSSAQRFKAIIFTTPAYQAEALSLLVDEANQAAIKLNIGEVIPITRSNLLGAYIAPPISEIKGQGLGNVASKKYIYCVSEGNKLSSIVLDNHDQELRRMVEKFCWPLSRINTNGACKLATQWMTALSMDVKGLNRDCKLFIEPVKLDGFQKNLFVPVYNVNWKIKGQETFGGLGNDEDNFHTVASVRLFLPTKMLMDLTVHDSKYILRKQLLVTNLDYMTNLVHLVLETNVNSSFKINSRVGE